MALGRSIKAGAAYVELFTEQSRYIRGLRKAEMRLKAFGARAQQIGRQMMMAGSIMVAPLVLATRIAVGFQDQILAVKAVTRATADEFDHLRNVVRKLARERPFTPAEIAGAALKLGRSNFAPVEIEATLGPVMDLARATGTDLTEATEIAADTLRAFRLPADQATRVVDALTAAANGSSQELTVLGESMQYMAEVASEADQSLEDTALAAGVLATLGLKGSRAGTGFRRMVTSFGEKETSDRLRGLGVAVEHVVDGVKKIRPMISIFTDLGKAAANLSSLERLQLFRELFDLRAMGAGLKLTRSNTEVFDRLMESMANADGIARQTASIMESKLGGALRRVKSAAEDVAIAISGAYGEALQGVADKTRDILNSITKWVEANKELVAGYAATAVGIIAAGAALFSLGVAASLAGMMLGGIAILFKTILSPVVLLSAALVGLAGYFVYASGVGGKALDWLAEKFGELKDRATKTIRGISDAMAAGDMELAGKILWLSLKMEWQRGVDWLNEIWFGGLASMEEATGGMLSKIITAFQAAARDIALTWTWLQEWISKTYLQVGLKIREASIRESEQALKTGELYGIGLNERAKAYHQEKLVRLKKEVAEMKPNINLAVKLVEEEYAKKYNTVEKYFTGLKTLDAKYLRDREKEAADSKRLAELEHQRDAAIARAARQREQEADRIKKGPLRGAGTGAPPQLAMATGDATRGTFSAFAANLLGMGGNAADRTAKATETTAKATEKTAAAAKHIEFSLKNFDILWARGG